MKRCIKCKKEKDESEFLDDYRESDRLYHKCVDCLREIVKENERIEKVYRTMQHRTNKRGGK